MDADHSLNIKPGGDFGKLTRFCLIDVGSTTTKAILFSKDGEWRFSRQEAPTTVEKPYEDVTFGVVNALRALSEQTGIRLLENDIPCIPCFSTSSAGGGLAIVVAGLVAEVTARSAERVALGAGAIVQDLIALNDDRTSYKKIEALQTLRPDMVLLAGGFDGGTVHGPVYLAELLNQSGLRPKLAERGRLPVIYAGNIRARQYVEDQLNDKFIYLPVPNLRPSDYRENLDPARDAIHRVFMDHVMSRAPGYDKYKSWISAPILPTPAAVSRILEIVSTDLNQKILAIDIGGATTDVFTAHNGQVLRTVSANLGMSYSILNVVRQGGLHAIMDLIDLDLDEKEVLDRIGNKFLTPTGLPENVSDTLIECAVASIAIREAIKEHLNIRHGLSLSLTEDEMTRSVIKRRKKDRKLFAQKISLDYDLVIGSGGKLSHSPRQTAAMILANALQSEGNVDLAVDSVFMFPQLGVLAQADPDLALELFHKFGLIRLGRLVAPSGTAKPGKGEIKVVWSTADHQKAVEKIPYGQVRFISIPGDSMSITVKPGKLKLNDKKMTLDDREKTLVVDGRGRPAISGGSYFLPDNYLPVGRKAQQDIESRIHHGPIAEARELAVPGEVFVKPGDIVTPETMVAKSSQAFLRPFFLHISDVLGIDPANLKTCFYKNVGDEIKPGEVIAQKKTGVINVKDFVSPVLAVIEKILPSGTVIAREKPDFARKSYFIDLAKELNLKPKRIVTEMAVELGQEVEKGQILAGRLTGGPSRVARSPIRGRVTDIDLDQGLMTIEPLLEELELKAWLPGKVDAVNDKGCRISNRGSIIRGIWGSGEQVYGRVSLEDGRTGDIAVRSVTSRANLEQLKSRQISGLITGGMHLKDFNELAPLFPVILTEGFGQQKMSRPFLEILEAHEGRTASIDPRTQLRAGVSRPRIILTEAD